MRIILWLLTLISLVGVYFANDIHTFLIDKIPLYSAEDSNILQVILAVIAGIIATKASDSSRELKKLMKVPEINEIIQKAETAQERFDKLEELIKDETTKQFARDMLVNHRTQLMYHWEQIVVMERILSENLDNDFDPKVKGHIRNYILKSRYLDYMGSRALKTIPVFGSFLDFLFGPIWDTYYRRNVEKFEKAKKKI